MKYKCVIFDFDGTICHSQPSIIESILLTAQYFNVSPIPDKEKIQPLISKGLTLKDTFRELFFLKNEAESEDYILKYREIYNSKGYLKSSIYPYCEELFENINKNNISIIITSNKGVDSINEFLKRFSIDKYISLVIGDTPGILKKPHPMSFIKFIRPKFNSLSLDEFLMVGDTIADIKYSQNCGIDCGFASYGYGGYEECSSLKPKFILTGLIDINNILGIHLDEKEKIIENKDEESSQVKRLRTH